MISPDPLTISESVSPSAAIEPVFAVPAASTAILSPAWNAGFWFEEFKPSPIIFS